MYDGEEVINILAKQKILKILNNTKVSELIGSYWKGPYEREIVLQNSYCYTVTQGFFKSKTSFLSARANLKKVFSLKHQLMSDWQMKPKVVKKYNFFTFEVWKKSLDVRYWTDGVIILTIAACLQLYVDGLTTRANIQDDYKLKYLSLAAQLQNPTITLPQRFALFVEFKEYEAFWAKEADLTIEGFQTMLYLCLILSAYFIKNLMQLVVAKLSSPGFSVFSLNLSKIGQTGSVVFTEMLMNLTQIIITVYSLLLFKLYYQKRSYDPENLRSAIMISEVVNDEFFRFQLLCAIIVGIQWARVFFVFQASKHFGPLIKILTNMLLDIGKFLIIFGLIFLIFLACGRMMFIELDDFSTSERAIVFLYSACLGNFDFGIFDEPMELPAIAGYIYLICFL